MAGSSLLESEDLFNSSYVPNNPSLVLDTDLWKTGEIHSGKSDESSPIVQLQPILIEPNLNNNDENFFLATEEGEGNYFTLSSSVQQDLSEFLLSGQQDLFTTVATSTSNPCHNSTVNSHEIVQEVFDLPVTTTGNDCTSADTPTLVDHTSDLQELGLQNLEHLDSILVNRSDNTEKEPKSNQETSEMHASIPPIVRNGNQFEYHNSWYIQSLNPSKASEALPFRKIKISPSSSPNHTYENHHEGIEATNVGDICSSENIIHHHHFDETHDGGGGGDGMSGIANGVAGVAGGTYVTSWNEATNPTGFLSPSAVSAAAAVAIGLSPTHLAYTEQYCHMQNGWASPSVAENPTDLSHAVPSPGLNPHHDCSGTDVNNVNQAQTNFIAYQNFGGYYGTTDEIYQQHSDKLYDLGTGAGTVSAGSPVHHRQFRSGVTRASAFGDGTAAAAQAPPPRLGFSFRPEPQSPSNRSSSDHEIDINSPRIDDLGYMLHHPTSPDSSTDGSKNVCNVCGKTYARPSTLKTHMRTHSGERPYRCYECNKSFSQAANLTAHCRTHSGEKPFHCNICNRRFSQSSSVTTHMRTHNGERPYKCRQCRKAFSDSSTLTKHLRIHSGEKPYQCKLCHLRFSQSGNLNRHMRTHELQQQHQQMHHRI